MLKHLPYNTENETNISQAFALNVLNFAKKKSIKRNIYTLYNI